MAAPNIQYSLSPRNFTDISIARKGNTILLPPFGTGTAPGNALTLSTDLGLTWTQPATTGLTLTSYPASCGNDTTFVMLGASKSAVSTDGISWTEYARAAFAPADIKWTGTAFFAYDTDGYITSPDGITWSTYVAFPAGGPVFGVAGTSTLLVAARFSSAPAVSTNNGLTWTNNAAVVGTTQWKGIAYNGSTFVMVGPGNTFAKSANGTAWTLVTVPATPAPTTEWRYIAAIGTNFIAYTAGGGAWGVYSDDGTGTTFTRKDFPTDNFFGPYVSTTTQGFITGDNSGNIAIVSFAPPGPAADFEGTGRIRITSTSGLITAPGGDAAVTGPAGTVSATGVETEPNSFAGTMSFSMLAYGGANAALIGPVGTLTIAGVNTIVGHAALFQPAGRLVASGTTANSARAALTGPAGTLVSYGGANATLTITGLGTLAAFGTTGSVGYAALTQPAGTLVASGTQGAYGYANIIGPSWQPVVSGRASLVGPVGVLTAFGAAIVVATYEAYAVNLLSGVDRNPQNQYDPDVSEVTHYLNYPFMQIVRHNNAYYGVAANGLYLLEGDTDAGAPIAWAFRTSLTDAGTKQFKRVRSVYVGARLINSVTVTLVVGEDQDLTYSYTTPRSSNAQNYRQMFGKGVRTRYFALEMSDAAGKFIEIDSLDLENEVLERAL